MCYAIKIGDKFVSIYGIPKDTGVMRVNACSYKLQDQPENATLFDTLEQTKANKVAFKRLLGLETRSSKIHVRTALKKAPRARSTAGLKKLVVQATERMNAKASIVEIEFPKAKVKVVA